MKRKESIDYIEGKKVFCWIEYKYTQKEFSAALRKIADDLEKYKGWYSHVNNNSASIEYSRVATKEEIQNERDKEEKENQQSLVVLQVRARKLGYKLVKNEQ